MEKIDLKPLGSVISIKGSPKRFMIVARAITVKTVTGRTDFFDYGGVMYPEGLTGKNMVYFQDKDIDEVVFAGFDDDANKRILDQIWSKLESLKIERADVMKIQEENRTANSSGRRH